MLSESSYLKLVCYQKVLSEIIILKLKKKRIVGDKRKVYKYHPLKISYRLRDVKLQYAKYHICLTYYFTKQRPR